MAKKLLETKEYKIDERVIGFGWNAEQLFEAVPNVKTVPQIFLNGEYIGGYDNLVAHFRAKESI